MEFLGCFWHGCDICYPDPNVRLAGNVQAGRLRELTLQRVQDLQNIYPRVDVIRECQFRRDLRRNAELREAYDQTYVIEPMHPRNDCLFGGRTEVFKVYHKCDETEEISHKDVVNKLFHSKKVRKFYRFPYIHT